MTSTRLAELRSSEGASVIRLRLFNACRCWPGKLIVLDRPGLLINQPINPTASIAGLRLRFRNFKLNA
jgi:hypothetical protein